MGSLQKINKQKTTPYGRVVLGVGATPECKTEDKKQYKNGDRVMQKITPIYDLPTKNKIPTPHDLLSTYNKYQKLKASRLAGAKRSYVTRNINIKTAKFLQKGEVKPNAGDLVLARIISLGQHKRLENTNGRRAFLHIGDEVILSYGARYASDQFEGYVPDDLSDCFMVAAGGIASNFASKNSRIKNPTKIKPIGLLCDKNKNRINLKNGAIATPPSIVSAIKPHIIAVLGSGMNAGKTTVAANIIHSLSKENLRVAALKITGTGAGGDMWQYQDAGAIAAYDFTDAGYATTYKTPLLELEGIMSKLLSAAKTHSPEVIVIEIADGLLQEETSYIIKSDWFKKQIDCIVYAARDGLSASAGVDILVANKLPIIAISGMLTSAPLCQQEAASISDIPILDANSYAQTASLAHALFASP